MDISSEPDSLYKVPWNFKFDTKSPENFVQMGAEIGLLYKSGEWTVSQSVDNGIQKKIQQNNGDPDMWTVKVQHFVRV